MRAISLWQPWATAIAIGVKRIETRHWSTSYPGPLAIHAAQRWDRSQRRFAGVEQSLGVLPKEIPLGAIVAICRLEDCGPADELVREITQLEQRYGNYDRGRFGWILTEVRALPQPIPFKGRQSFFDVPDHIFEKPLTAAQMYGNREQHGHFGAGHS